MYGLLFGHVLYLKEGISGRPQNEKDAEGEKMRTRKRAKGLKQEEERGARQDKSAVRGPEGLSRCNSILCLFMSGVTQKAGCAKRVCGRNGYATIKAEETSGALIVSRKRYHCTILVRRSERRSRSGESGGGQISEFVG